MKIYITGGTGFVGINLNHYYNQHDVYNHVRGQTATSQLEQFRPDLIINSAAEIYTADFMWDPNVMLTKECLEYCVRNPTTAMIQIGSSSEYGPISRASSEQDRINPVDMYQTTKGIATLLCQGYARTYNLRVSIARPYSVYGPHERPHRLFPRLWKAFNRNEPMTLFNGYHDFIYINDFVRGLDLLAHDIVPGQGDIVNFGSGQQYSNFSILELFEHVTGRTAPVEKVNRLYKKFESTVWVCDTKHAQERYNFKTTYTIVDGIKEFLEKAQY